MNVFDLVAQWQHKNKFFFYIPSAAQAPADEEIVIGLQLIITLIIH